MYLIGSIGLDPQSAVTLYIYRMGWTYPAKNPVYRSKSIKNPSCTRTLLGPVRPVGPCRTGHSARPVRPVGANFGCQHRLINLLRYSSLLALSDSACIIWPTWVVSAENVLGNVNQIWSRGHLLDSEICPFRVIGGNSWRWQINCNRHWWYKV